jgi:hypothetical protein
MCKLVGTRLDWLRCLVYAMVLVALAATAFPQSPETISGALPDTETDLPLGAATFIEQQPPKPLRTWDQSNWGRYKP